MKKIKKAMEHKKVKRLEMKEEDVIKAFCPADLGCGAEEGAGCPFSSAICKECWNQEVK